MPLARLPIRRRLMAMLLLTSGAVLLLTCASFFAYEFLTFRQTAVSDLTTLGEIIAANSTAALAFANPEDAREVLSALWAEKHVVAAALYDRDGRLFATFPPSLPARAFPEVPAAPGYRFERGRLVGSQPVVQGDNGRLGTLYLRSDMGAMDERVRHYALIAALVLAVSLVVAYLISRRLQRQISQPLLALAETARAVSDRRDYSVRAAPAEGQELELLTEGFNHMLARIEEQHQTLGESAGRLRAVLNSALSAVVVIDAQGLIVDWNARAEAMFGWPQNEALGRSLAATIIPPRYREAHHQGLERLRAGGEGPILNRLLELSALRRDGDEFPVELCVSPLITGGVRSFCGFITDLTERRQAQEKLEAQLGRLELLNRITRAIGERQDLPSVFQVVVRTLEE
ncbi:MAG: PAS domain S-box protein, partial [Thermoanaerobaculia bacterium]